MSTFAGVIAHDINNQLTVILNHLELCFISIGPGDPVHDSLGDIQKASLRCAELTNRLLEDDAGK
ncbi:MAG: hypothetical protein M3Z85_11090 [Acidobacteriota bacterium]|nr:hypothetical protein [Acidobacteriota bacterium]